MIRIHKFLSTAGICSRRKAEKYIQNGRIKINREIVKKLGTKINVLSDVVFFDNKLVKVSKKKYYIVLNKPRGYICSCKHCGEKTVVSLVKQHVRLFPVGRLDKDSSGLLIMTNDGRIHNRLIHPSFSNEKEYLVTVIKKFNNYFLKKMQKGIMLNGKYTLPTKIYKISDYVFKIILTEGRNRQIRRMVGSLGNNVINLKRVRIGKIKLGTLPTAKWRNFFEKEKKYIKELLRCIDK